MTEKDAKFSFFAAAHRDQDPTVREVRHLRLEETVETVRPKAGYNPYERDMAPQDKRDSARAPRTDLRKLSEWIKLRQQIEAQKTNETTEASPTETAKPPRPKL